MPEINNDNLNNEEQELLDRLREIQAKKKVLLDWENAIVEDAEYNLAQAKKNAPVLVTMQRIENDKLEIAISRQRDDVYRAINGHRTSQLSYLDNLWRIDPTEYKALLQKLSALPNIIFKHEITAEEIISYQAPPHFDVSLTNKDIVIKVSAKANVYLIRPIPGCTVYPNKKEYHIPLTEAWRIPDRITDADTIRYTAEAHDFVFKLIENRAKLDIIAKKTEPDEVITLRDGIQLKGFQSVGVEFLEATGGKGILGDEMGLGKTPTSIAVAERLCDRQEGSKILIICPASIKPNWMREIKKFTAFRAYELTGSKPNNYDIIQLIQGGHRYYIINYDILSDVTKIPEKLEVDEVTGLNIRTAPTERFLWLDVLNVAQFDMVIVDEAHYIKNIGSNRSRAVRELKAPRFMLLTGTPILNRPQELWPLIKMIDSDAAGAYESFVRHYTIDGKQTRNVDELREILKPIMIRRTKKDVLKELPPIERITREYDISTSARRQYEAVLAGFWGDLDKWDGSTTNTQTITSLLAQLMKMKQVVAWDKVSNIVDLANELYEQSSDDEHRKVIIFSQFVNKPPVVHEIYNRLNIVPDQKEAVFISGEQDVYARQAIVDEFQTNSKVHFLVSGLKAAREGLNITAAGSVIFADLDWTPANHHQAEARAYGRLSDLHSIGSYYVVGNNTIEEDIMGLLGAKLAIFNEIIEGAEASRQDSSIAMELIKKLKEMR